MSIPPAVHAEYNIAHFAVGEFYHVIIDEHSVRCKSKIEDLVVLLFQLSSIRNYLFANIPVYQRFASEKVHLKMPACSGILHQIIQSALSDFGTHDAALAAVVALACKAVFTVHVAAVCHVEADRFED